MTTTTNDKMVNVMTQTTFGDDMPEYISIYQRPNKPKGRPKNKIQLTDEEKRTYEKTGIKALLRKSRITEILTSTK